MTQHEAHEYQQPDTGEPAPGRVARDHPKYRIRGTRGTQALYGAIGGVGAFGAGALARQFPQPHDPPSAIVYTQPAEAVSTTRAAPDTISVEDLKREMRLVSAATKAAGADAPRAAFIDEVRSSPLTVDLSAEAAGAFAATLLLDILKEARRRLIGRVVDTVMPERGDAEPVPAAGVDSRGVGHPGATPIDVEVRQLVDELAGYRRRAQGSDLRVAARRAIGDSLGDGGPRERAGAPQPGMTSEEALRVLAGALDTAEQAVAADLQRRRPRSRRTRAKTRGEAKSLAAAVRHEADRLIAGAGLGQVR